MLPTSIPVQLTAHIYAHVFKFFSVCANFLPLVFNYSTSYSQNCAGQNSVQQWVILLKNVP